MSANRDHHIDCKIRHLDGKACLDAAWMPLTVPEHGECVYRYGHEGPCEDSQGHLWVPASRRDMLRQQAARATTPPPTVEHPGADADTASVANRAALMLERERQQAELQMKELHEQAERQGQELRAALNRTVELEERLVAEKNQYEEVKAALVRRIEVLEAERDGTHSTPSVWSELGCAVAQVLRRRADEYLKTRPGAADGQA